MAELAQRYRFTHNFYSYYWKYCTYALSYEANHFLCDLHLSRKHCTVLCEEWRLRMLGTFFSEAKTRYNRVLINNN